MIVIKPLSTEKASKMMERGIYAFVVSANVKKSMIKREVEKIFSVKVDHVMSLTRPKKTKSFRGVGGEVGGGKKVYVKVANGMKINFDDVVKQ